MKVKSDHYNKVKNEMDEMSKPMSMKDIMGECIPVDMYGKRISIGKDNDLKTMEKDIQEFYSLEGDLGMGGGE